MVQQLHATAVVHCCMQRQWCIAARAAAAAAAAIILTLYLRKNRWSLQQLLE
jgi:hypothetical protein